MISVFEKKIRSSGIGSVQVQDRIEFLKFNTPGSITGLYAKVIFLVFKNTESEPFLCVKTVRKAEDNFLIENGFNNLKILNSMIKNAPVCMYFPEALILDYYSDIAFSVETALHGKHVYDSNLEDIITSYTTFQKYLTVGYMSTCSFRKSVGDICAAFAPDLAETLVNFSITLDGSSIDVVHLPQHGDMTFDNMFIGVDGVPRLIDCEEFGVYTIAGLDLYHLLSRAGHPTYSSQRPFLDTFFKNIGAPVLSPALFFLLYIADQVRKYPLRSADMNSTSSISHFERLLE